MPQEVSSNSGQRLIVLRTGAENGGALLEMEAIYPPQSEKPPAHYHPHQEEQFAVLDGTFRVWLGEDEQTFTAGDTFTVPAGTPHAMQNSGDQPGRLLWKVRPALRTEQFLTTMWRLETRPPLLQLAVIMNHYQDEMRLARPPYPVQRLLFGLLAALGRLRGYRPPAGE